MTINLPPGSTGRSVYFRVYKDDGKANATLNYSSANLAATYTRDNGSPVSIALAPQSLPTNPWATGGFVSRGHGEYRLDVPDAALAAGATTVSIVIAEATDIRAEPILLTLDATVSSRLASLGANAPAGWINAAAIADGALTASKFGGAIPANATQWGGNALPTAFLASNLETVMERPGGMLDRVPKTGKRVKWRNDGTGPLYDIIVMEAAD